MDGQLRVAVGLGTSLGDVSVLDVAVGALSAGGARVLRVSRIHRTPPAGGVASRPFHNAAILVEWGRSLPELLALSKRVEERVGRRWGSRWGDRTLDIDLLWAEVRHHSTSLKVPHPRLAERAFALTPLLEVWPDVPLSDASLRPRCAPVALLAGPPVGKPVRSAVSRPRRIGAPMKFFIDTANLNEIRQAASWGIIDGVTTNPSLIAKEGGDFVSTIAEICTIVDGPVSAEVVAEDADTMVTQGKLLARIHDNVVVKVPLTEAGITATSRFSALGIKTNVTLCFQPIQALLAAKAGATYVSPFVGRIDDVGWDGNDIIAQIVELYANYPELETQVLSASLRHPAHVLAAAMAGSHVATIPFGVLKKLFGHPLTDIGNEKFTKAWEGVPDSNIEAQVGAWLERNGR